METQMTLRIFLLRMVMGWGFSSDLWIRRFGEKLYHKLTYKDLDAIVSVDFDHHIEDGRRVYVWQIKGAELPRNWKSKLASHTTFEVRVENAGFTLVYRPKSYARS